MGIQSAKVNEITIGFGGAAGDGLDRSGNVLARTVNRMGLYAISYNSHQSLIRGGNTFLKIRIAEKQVDCLGDGLNLFVALNQDSIERYAGRIDSGGAVIFNSDKMSCDASLLPSGVEPIALPVKEITKEMSGLLPVMQNMVALGSALYLMNIEIQAVVDVIGDIFKYKGQEVIDLNSKVIRAGYEYVQNHFKASKTGQIWTVTRIRRPFYSGNEAMALGAVVGGLKFYAAYPMSPASSILHWLIAHSEKCGVVVKQAEDEIAVVNMAIGAGNTGVRSMCATSGGGFSLMTEAVGEAAMLEAPVVIVNVMRGGPSTGLPTKTEQADLNQAIGASQGDFPKVVMAPQNHTECFYMAAEALNIAEKYQLPVIILSDLLMGENFQTIETDAWRNDVLIDRGELVREVSKDQMAKDGFKRYTFTKSGVSPRPVLGTEGMAYVAASDDHDEDGVLISDVFTNQALRRKSQDKRMAKLGGILKELKAPALEGPDDADVTLIGWGSSWGVIKEAAQQLTAKGIAVNRLHIKYLFPFHAKEVAEILGKCKKTICVENNFSGQLARHIRAESGFSVDDKILKYDGEPFEPRFIVERVTDRVEGKSPDLSLTEDEAREISYHYIRVHLHNQLRPSKAGIIEQNDYGEPVWEMELIDRKEKNFAGKLMIGRETGAIYKWIPVSDREVGA